MDIFDNKNKIKRWNKFREMVFKDIVNLFHDKKNKSIYEYE